MASNGSCFVVTWIIFKNRLLEVGLTQNQEIMAIRTLTTVGLFHIIVCGDPHEYTFIEIPFRWGPGHIWLHTILEGPWPHYMILEASWDGLWTISFGLSESHGHGPWLMWEVALRQGCCDSDLFHWKEWVPVISLQCRPVQSFESWFFAQYLDEWLSGMVTPAQCFLTPSEILNNRLIANLAAQPKEGLPNCG